MTAGGSDDPPESGSPEYIEWLEAKEAEAASKGWYNQLWMIRQMIADERKARGDES